jgi:hypothetical protein
MKEWLLLKEFWLWDPAMVSAVFPPTYVGTVWPVANFKGLTTSLEHGRFQIFKSIKGAASGTFIDAETDPCYILKKHSFAWLRKSDKGLIPSALNAWHFGLFASKILTVKWRLQNGVSCQKIKQGGRSQSYDFGIYSYNASVVVGLERFSK